MILISLYPGFRVARNWQKQISGWLQSKTSSLIKFHLADIDFQQFC